MVNGGGAPFTLARRDVPVIPSPLPVESAHALRGTAHRRRTRANVRMVEPFAAGGSRWIGPVAEATTDCPPQIVQTQGNRHAGPRFRVPARGALQGPIEPPVTLRNSRDAMPVRLRATIFHPPNHPCPSPCASTSPAPSSRRTRIPPTR